MDRRTRTIVLVFAAAGMVSTLTGAQAQEPARQRFALTVEPARFVVTPEAIRYGQTFDVSDTGLDPLHVDAFVADFTQRANGEIEFEPPRPLSAALWVRIEPTSFDLDPGQHRSVHLSISPRRTRSPVSAR